MKKFILLFAAISLTLIILAGLAVVKSAALSEAPDQFEGYVTYFNGQPAPVDTEVTAWLDGTVRSIGHVEFSDGYYLATGFDENNPTGTYTLTADDGSTSGSKVCYHVFETTTRCDIVLTDSH